MAYIAAYQVHSNWLSILLFALLELVRLIPNNLLEVHDSVVVDVTRNILYQLERRNYNLRTTK